MSNYTINGYLAALQLRETCRTLLVEGPLDRMFIERLLHELTTRERCKRDTLTVDTVDIVKAEGNGARVLVELLHATTSAPRTQFGGLVDREYRHFTFTP